MLRARLKDARIDRVLAHGAALRRYIRIFSVNDCILNQQTGSTNLSSDPQGHRPTTALDQPTPTLIHIPKSRF